MRPYSTSRLPGCRGRSPAFVIRPSSYPRLRQAGRSSSTNAGSDNGTCSTSQGANEQRRAPGDSPAAVSRRTALCMTAGLPLVLTAQAALATEPPAAPTVLPERESKLGFVDRVREFTLSNGLHFIVLPRTTAPVVSVHILADVGAYQEEEGSTGLAHLLEHMAFKGTRRVGARDWAREAPLLDAMDEVFYELRDLKSGTQGPVTAARVALLTDKLKQLQVEADALVVPNAYGATLSRAGGVGLNASTSQDETRYFVSLPSNKVELWFALEAERFRAPVFRELYSEKKVIEEERRSRVDNAPLGKFQQEFAARSLTNNYRRPVIGLEEDFDKLGRREVANFFAQHYGPRNLTIALVGDVTPEQVEQLAMRYWGGWQGHSAPSVSPTSLPITSGLVASRAAVQSDGAGRLEGLDRAALAWRQDRAFGGRFLAVTSPSQGSGANSSCNSGATPAGGPCYADSSVGGPLVMLGFPRPPMIGPDGATISVMSDLLSGSRTSRLAGRLVLQQRRLRGVRCAPSYPGDKYDGMVLLAAVPLQGGRPEEAEKLILDELERFVDEGPTQAELARVQKSTKTGVLASALSNSAMASLLASYHTSTGSWRGLLDELEEVAAMKPEGVQAVSQRLLSRQKMFTGYVYAKA